jgi:hypothetical protein
MNQARSQDCEETGKQVVDDEGDDPRLTGVANQIHLPGRSKLALAEESGVPFLIALFPNGDNLVDGNIALFAFVILQMQNAVFDFSHVAAQAGGGTTKDINLLSD